MKRKYLYFLLVLATIASCLILAMQSSNAKYKDKSDLDIAVTSAKMYFQDDASDLDLPFSNNTANLYFDVHNYIEQNYTVQDINYTVSISNSNYSFKINDNDSQDNKVSMTIAGGERNTDELHMIFHRTATSDVPASEEIVVTIETTYPYKYTKTFTVTILSGAIEVQGNPTNWTKNDVTLTVVATTGETTLKEYSFDNGTTWVTNPSKVYTENTNDISILAKDSLGQTLGPVVVDITKIDKTPPSITFSTDIEYNEDGSQKEVETLIVTLNEATSVLTGVTANDTQSGLSAEGVKCYKNGVEITTTDYFTNVGRYAVTYKVEDEAGNETTLDREILVRWPRAGKYVAKKTEIDGAGIVGTGLATDSTKMGLYKDNTDTGLDSSLEFSSKYYYAGKTVNNYFTFNQADSTKSFRILNVAVNDEIKLVGKKSSDSIRYAPTHEQARQGFLNTELYQTFSSLWPNKQFYIDSSDKVVFTDNEWAHINGNATFYIGGFKAASSQSIASTVQCEREGDSNWTNATSYTGYSAFPNVSDYLKTSNQQNTIYSFSSSSRYITFANNSWIASGIGINASESQWTINGGSEGNMFDRYFYYFMYGNQIGDRNPLDPNRIRVTFYIKEDTILSGIGTESDPFTVQEDWAWFDPYQTVQ